MSKLKEIPFLQPYPSHANFILAKVTTAPLMVLDDVILLKRSMGLT
jgi:histidinol-phosphate/aromatic aminotransferase/cobyric acid decarboxylase-like protein